MMIASKLHNPLLCPPLRLRSPFSVRNFQNLACSSMLGCGRVGLPLSLPSAADSSKLLARHFSAPLSLRLRNLRQDLIHARNSDVSAVATSKGALRCSLISSFASGWTTFKEGIAASASDISGGINEVKMISELEQALGTPFDVGPQVPPPKPLVIVISGPSGVGKDAVIKRLQEVRKEIHFVVTATTRAKRPGEVDGVDYFFVSKEEFKNMIEKNELLEHALVYGDYKGIPKKQMRQCLAEGKDVVLRVDVQGAATVRSILGSNAVFIFVVAESEFALVKRLVERKTETMEKLLVRIATARDELQRLENFEYAVVNADGQLEKTVNAVCGIIDAEKARVLQKVANI